MKKNFDEGEGEEKKPSTTAREFPQLGQQQASATPTTRGGNQSREKNEDNSIGADLLDGPARPIPRPSPPKAPPHPRQLRTTSGLQRPNLRRQVIVASTSSGVGGHGDILHGDRHGSLELTGVLPAGLAAGPVVPPKRPTRLPARYAAGLGIHGQLAGEQKPNRYSWAQMQHWQQAAAASKQQTAAAAAAAAAGAAPTDHQGFHHHFSSPFSTAASRVLVVNPMQIVNLSEHTKSSLIKFIEAIKRFSEKWFSHVLLLLFLAVYACFGAYIFISFEAPTEHWEKQLIIDTRWSIVNDSWHQAHEQGKTRDEFLDLFRQKLEDYERILNRACASGMTSSSLENQWTFWGALFYSMTVFTTIGYGHLTPITFAGRVATMVYAIFGIPILLMVLADLGKLLTRIIKYAFKKFRYLFNKLLRRKSSLRTRKLISDNTHQYIGVARDAFERGFAYVQHQPAALRVNSFKQKFFLKQQHQKQQRQQQVDNLILEQSIDIGTAGDGADPPPSPTGPSDVNRPVGLGLVGDGPTMEETTDVIVTPAKQTKPVSPPIEADKKSLADTVIQAHHAAASAHINNHHHHRSQSPAFRIRRKVSTSGLMGSRRHHNQVVKGSVSKSSSSNVVHPPDKEKQQQQHKKHSQDTSDQLPVAPTEKTTTAIDEKPKSDPISMSDVDITTDETIDVVGEFEMDEEVEEGEEEEEEEEGAEDDEMEDEFDIPVSFALFLLVTYMMFGAVVFSIWEGWNFFDSLYFVFISMSTIGFGDLVPQHPKRMIGTFIYLLFGLALTSMCINVVQEKIHATFLRAKMQIGEKMGFDLDQIMADDYYDGSLVYDVEGGETAEDTNSLAVSQTYSATGTSPGDHHHHSLAAAADGAGLIGSDPGRPTSQSLDGAPQQIRSQTMPHVDGLKQSKSKESLKAKKRSVGSLPGSGGSFKRKPSKKMSRHAASAAPSSPTTTTATIQLPDQTQPAANNSVQQQTQPTVAATINVMPLRSQIEVHRTEPVISQLDNQQPCINAPINNFRNTCEPLRAKVNDEFFSNRPKLISTRSLQPNLHYQTDPSRSSPAAAGSSRLADLASLRAGSETPGISNHHQRRPPIKSSSYQGKSDLEAALSRRSSVSHELNQLDDLIVALSRSPSDRFGPLLGIPSSNRSSRSNSPTNQLSARRGTSMTSRSPSKAAHHQTLTKNASAASVHKMMQQPLNLSESQAALDELEAIKLRL